jgi:uncharacterized protein (DUF697 family)
VTKREQKAAESAVVVEKEQKAQEVIIVVGEKEHTALKIVRKYMWWSMGAGLIPVPFVDWAAVSGVQLKMVADVSKVYGVPFQENSGKAVIGSMAGFVLPQMLACGTIGFWLKQIPVVGALAGAPAMVVFCGAAEYALGKTFIQHFESGGTFLDFNPDEVREYYKAQFEEGHKVAASMGTHQRTEEKAEAPA